jgi:hypothetical protein
MRVVGTLGLKMNLESVTAFQDFSAAANHFEIDKPHKVLRNFSHDQRPGPRLKVYVLGFHTAIHEMCGGS